MHLPDSLVPPYWLFQLWDRLRSPQSWVHNGRWLVGSFACVVLTATGAAWTQINTPQGLTEIRKVDALVALPTDGPRPVLTVGTTVGDDNRSQTESDESSGTVLGTTYLVAGVDSRSGADGMIGAGTNADVDGARSDTIGLVHISPNGVPKVVGIPRDSGVYQPTCQRWQADTGTYQDAPVPAGDDVKINSTYARGGPRCLVATVQQLTGIKIDKFVGVDFAGMIQMVNAVGGVDIDSPYPLVDDELGVIVETAGPHHLNGEQALAYCRARKIAQEGKSDYGRIKRQQKLVQALTIRIKQQILHNPTRLDDLAASFTKNIFGDNVSMDDLLDQLPSLTGAQFQTIPTVGTNARGNEVVDRHALGLMLQGIWGGTTNPGDSPAHAPTTTPAG